MQSPPNIDVLKSNDFISTRKRILIERVMSPREKKMLENNEEFVQFMNQKNIKDRNQDYMQEFLKRKKRIKLLYTWSRWYKGILFVLRKKFQK